VQAHFAGRVSDEELYSWLRTASVVVTMSERESFGLTVLEAVTAGARVVASDIPAHRETATYGGADRSLFVAGDAGDADALTDAIRRSLRAGRPSGPPADVLSWDAMAGDVAATYGSLSQARSRSTRPQPESSVPQPAGGGTLSTMPGGRWLRRYRDLARAHLFVVTAARRTERAGVMRFVGRQAARFAGLHVGGDTQVQFRRMTYVVDESAELHTLVELYRDEYYSRAPGFLPRAGSTVVDVGANVGVFTLFHAAAGADVLALEPNHAAYERLTRAVAINGLESRVTGVNAAGGAVPGWGRLHLDEGLSVLGSVVAEEAGDEASERVEIVTLDELIARLGLGPIDLLKVDVEGAEAEVLRGARATLHDVRRVIIEYHTPALLAEVRGLLADAAFREVMAFPASGDGAGMLYAERD
jgi:FkbM family methyltransferase